MLELSLSHVRKLLQTELCLWSLYASTAVKADMMQPYPLLLTQHLVFSCVACVVDLTSTFAVPAVRARRHAKLQTAVEEALLSIICAVNDKKDHIPPVVSPHLVTFPFDITVAGYAYLCDSLACYIKQVFTAPPDVGECDIPVRV